MPYREAQLWCPACREPMDERPYKAANVDVCTGCHGAWIEWFDGEIPVIAASIPPPSRPSNTDSAVTRECPACRCGLTFETLGGASIGRCGECAGAFLTRDAIDVIAAFAKHMPPPRADESPGWLERILTLVRSVLTSNVSDT